MGDERITQLEFKQQWTKLMHTISPDAYVFRKQIHFAPYIFVVLYLMVCGFVLAFSRPEMFSSYSLIGGIFIPIFLVYDFIKSRHFLIFDTNEISVRSLLGDKSLQNQDIRGFHNHYDSSGRYLKSIVFHSHGNDTIKIQPDSYKNMMQLLECIQENFVDLDQLKRQNEEAELNAELLEKYQTPEKVAKIIGEVKGISTALSWASGVPIIIAFLPLTAARNISVALSLAILLVTVTVAILYKGMFTLALPERKNGDDTQKESEKSSRADLFFPLMIPAGFLIYSAWQYRPVSLENLWIPGFIVACVLYFGMSIGVGLGRHYYISLLSYLLIGFGAVFTLNCGLDDSPKTYEIKVLEKHVERGKRTSYVLTLEHKKYTGKTTASVDLDFYKNIEIGTKVRVERFEGRFSIPWYRFVDEY